MNPSRLTQKSTTEQKIFIRESCCGMPPHTVENHTVFFVFFWFADLEFKLPWVVKPSQGSFSSKVDTRHQSNSKFTGCPLQDINSKTSSTLISLLGTIC